MIETSDLIFALDSLSASFSITRDSFLMFTSNIMAVRGLRSLYFWPEPWTDFVISETPLDCSWC